MSDVRAFPAMATVSVWLRQVSETALATGHSISSDDIDQKYWSAEKNRAKPWRASVLFVTKEHPLHKREKMAALSAVSADSYNEAERQIKTLANGFCTRRWKPLKQIRHPNGKPDRQWDTTVYVAVDIEELQRKRKTRKKKPPCRCVGGCVMMHDMEHEHLKQRIREIPDFPTPGIRFKDITPLLADKEAFRQAIDGLAALFPAHEVDKVVGIDARGFLLASATAYLWDAGMVMVRKRGKLPWEKIVQEHDLEYGQGLLEVHKDAIAAGERVVIIDDVLATGGTAGAAVKLVEALEGKILGLAFLLEIKALRGREKLKPHPAHSLIID